MKRIILAVVALAAMVAPAVLRAQDPVKVDAKHYTVVFENDAVRVLRIHYAPGEKSVMHSHPDAVAVFLGDSTTTMTTPDGKSQVMTMKANSAQFTPAGAHLPDNTGKTPVDLFLVELKAKPATAK
jgi:oxalate decarboxylase/phosphoglucose isomerase-like protein (cupin superfamily)